MRSEDVLETADRIARPEQSLAERLNRRGWKLDGDGITSPAWNAGARPGREAIASRLPARADGTWDTRIAGSSELSVALRAIGAQPTAAELVDGRVVYRDAYLSTHLVLSTDLHEAELNFVLLDARAPHEFTFAIANEAGGLTSRQVSEREIAFLDRAGQTRLLLGAPRAIDRDGVTREGSLALDGARVHMRLDTTGLQYPIVFDPPLGTPSWSQLATGTPPARSYYGMATLGTKIVLFGGRKSDGSLTNETWLWNGTSWSQRTDDLDVPSARAPGQQMAAYGDSIILFGGAAGVTDTWLYSELDGWVPVITSAAPPAREGGILAGALGSLYLFGGQNPTTGVDLDDTWRWAETRWEQVSPTTSPSARSYAAATTLDDKITLFGGTTSSGSPSNETWTFDGTNWTLLTPTASPPGRIRAPMVTLGTQVVLFGGQPGGSTRLADTWSWDGTNWQAWTGISTAPVGRAGAQLATLNGSAVMFGGFFDGTYYADTWKFEVEPPKANGQSCTAPAQCGSGFCTDGVCCASACGDGASDCQACNVSGSAGTCTFLGASTTCRAAVAECDVAEVCSGSAATCPADAKRANSFTCRGSTGGCDVAETCDGTTNTCPADAKAQAGSSCRAASCASGQQTLAASCSGTDASCPTATLEACGNYACDSQACFTSCNTAAQCETGYYCDAAHTCQVKLSSGVSCNADSQCGMGHCVDGVCCNASCTGQCEACDIAGMLGTCAPIPANGAPHGFRSACDTDTTACGGKCDGTQRTACAYPGSSTTCRNASCSNGTATLAGTCGGSGSCGARMTQACAPFTCNGASTQCNGNCSADSDCSAGNFCSAGVCTLKLQLGVACSGAAQCQSGLCVDAVCCNAACDQQCQACDAPSAAGTCTPVMGAPHGSRPACAGDPASCGGACDGTLVSACEYPDNGTLCRPGSCSDGTAVVPAFCDGAGACPPEETRACERFSCATDSCRGDCAQDSDCASGSFCFGSICTAKRANGMQCPGSNACASGFCVDGACCDVACNGQCEACDVTGHVGTCSASFGAPHGVRTACTTDGTACGGECDGSSRTRCGYPGDATQCREAGCADGVAVVAASCNGTGTCPARQEQVCTPYRCGATLCAGDCVTTSDCQSNYYCSGGLCQAKLAQGQACGSSDQCATDNCVDGYCCDRACDGQCESCGLSSSHGTCSPAQGAPVGGRAACAGSGTCAGTCNGIEAASCTYPASETTCIEPSCAAGVATDRGTCDGSGSCGSAVHRECAPYACAGGECLSACNGDAECAGDQICRDGRCRPMVQAEPDASVPSREPDAGSKPAADSGVITSVDNRKDTDGDGIPDIEERGPNGEAKDTDGDGIPDYKDPEKVEVGGSSVCTVAQVRAAGPGELWTALGAVCGWVVRRRVRRRVERTRRIER